MRPHRAEIWLVDFGEPIGVEQAGRRPAVVVSADGLNESAAGVIIAIPCTTTRRELPSHIELDAAKSGLDETSYAMCEDIKSISTRRLISRLGEADDTAMLAIERALRFLLDL